VAPARFLMFWSLVIEACDDGKGIDWAKVAQCARTHDLAHRTRAQLVEAVFAPGLSTTEVVSETSGRGVGMSAVLEECRALGGECTVESELGRVRSSPSFSHLRRVTAIHRRDPRCNKACKEAWVATGSPFSVGTRALRRSKWRPLVP
jgi:hypothetical protein